MGVMIKGLEMPKNCMGCSTKCDPENRKCNIDGHVFEETFAVVTNKRDKDCPLVEIEDEESQDGVSRAVVLQLINDVKLANGFNEYSQYEYLFDQVDKMPSVMSTRKKGEWCKQNDDYFDWYECSECGYGSNGEMQYSSECDVRTKFCPNCGADMRGTEDEM